MLDEEALPHFLTEHSMDTLADIRLLANILDHSSALICAVGPHGQLQHVSGACWKVLGWEKDQLLSHSFADLVHPDDRPAAVDACQRALSQHQAVPFESRCLSPAGGEVIMEWSAFRPPADALLVCIGRDVTEERRAARRAREQEAFYQAVAEHGFDIMALLSTEGVYTYMGGSVQKALGYRPEEMVGRSPFEFIHADDVAAAQAAWAELGSQPVFAVPDCRFRAATGEWRWMETTISNQLLNPAIQAFTLCSRDITDKRNRAFELATSEQRFRLLFEHNLAPSVFQDADGRVLDVNPAYLGFLQMTKEQVLHRQLTDVLPAGLVSGSEQQFRAVLSGQPLTYEPTLVYEGAERTLSVTKIPLVVEGQIVGVYSTGHDITDMAAAQRLIKQQAARLETILESITDAFLSLDRDWNLTYLNREAESMLGLERSKWLGKNLWKIFPKGRHSVYHEQGLEALETGQTAHFEVYAPGLNRWLEIKMFPSPEGLAIYFSDITQRVESDKQLKLLALVAQDTVNGVIITDAEGRVEWVNAGFTRDTGYTLAEMLGRKPDDVLHGPETDPAAVRRFQERLPLSKPFSITILNYKKTGQKLWLAMDITPIFNDAGELTQYIAILQNINFRKEVEASQAKMTEELYRHNRDLQQFAYVISHNLRAPLANALGLSSILAKVDRQSPLFDTSLAHLRESMGQADTVLKDLNLVLSIRDKQDQQDQQVPEPVALAEVCRQAVHNLDEPLQQCGGLVKIDVPDDLSVHGNRAYLYSIFYNLLSNSIKYRAERRSLLVEITCFYNEKGGLSISFTDNGSGFDMFKAGSDVFQLYKRFHTNQRGRGIGLFLVKTHVEALGGKIEVTSGVDFGTRFLIQLDTI
jgi:PAS domain S-box-containing protein